MAKTIVILGGGVGGLVAANRLRRLLNREHRIVLVDRSLRMRAFYDLADPGAVRPLLHDLGVLLNRE